MAIITTSAATTGSNLAKVFVACGAATKAAAHRIRKALRVSNIYRMELHTIRTMARWMDAHPCTVNILFACLLATLAVRILFF